MTTETKPLMSDSTYDHMKQGVQLVLPACGSLYFGLAQIWGMPNAEEVVGTFSVLAVFLGVVLNFSARRYEETGAGFAGDVLINETSTGTKVYTLSLNGDPEDIDHMESVTFRVVPK